jgi:hypothetical protein
VTAINAVYPSALDAFLSGQINYPADTIKVVALRPSYAYDATHDTLADVPFAARIATATLPAKAIAGGAATAAAVAITPLTGDVIGALVVYQDTGVEATSRLIAYLGQRSDLVPISVLTNGQTITISWPNGNVFTI